MKMLFVAGVSYKTAAVALREKLAVAPSNHEAVGRRLIEAGGLSELVLLWTCNRVEIYGVAEDVDGNLSAMLRCLTEQPLSLGSEVFCHKGDAALHHLFSVAGGLDSMVLGETEITGQVKQAYERSHAAGFTGKVLNRSFQKALEVAKEIRTQTGIGKGATSVGSVTVQHAQRMFGESLASKRVMVIGAGQMAEVCIRHLVKKGVKDILVANRSLENAKVLAEAVGGRPVAFEGFCQLMTEVDIVISSTGCPHTIIHRQQVEAVMAARADRPLVVLDIAVPRDVDPELKNVPGVHLFDIDDLAETVRSNIATREQDLVRCREIIEARAAALMKIVTPALQGVAFVAPRDAACLVAAG